MQEGVEATRTNISVACLIARRPDAADEQRHRTFSSAMAEFAPAGDETGSKSKRAVAQRATPHSSS